MGFLQAVPLLLALPALLASPPRAPSRGGPVTFGLSIGVAAFGRAASGLDEAGQPLTFSPYRPTMRGVELSVGREGPRIGVAAAWGRPGLLIRGAGGATPGLLLVAPGAYRLAAYGAGVSVPLVRLRGGPVIRPAIGIRLERWSAAGSPPRWIGGAEVGVALEVALADRLAVSVEGQVGCTAAAPFRREDLPAGFTPGATRRRSLGVALRRRF